MPVATARQAEVVPAHPHPLEVRRRGEHLPQQLVVRGLDPGALAQRPLRIGDPLGQVIAQPLQLAQAKDPGLAANRVDPVGNLHPAKGLSEEAGELALEMADLPP
jgi:hypothetical protein